MKDKKQILLFVKEELERYLELWVSGSNVNRTGKLHMSYPETPDECYHVEAVITGDSGVTMTELSTDKTEKYKHGILVKDQTDPAMNGIRYVSGEDLAILNLKPYDNT